MAAPTTTRDQQTSFSNYRTMQHTSYHVFLSFRGADIRNTFADHLYTAFIDAGFRTFRDDDEIERGEDISFELKKAIQQSRSSIIVFSENYASSRWCLNELVLILEQKRWNSNHTVLPIFYHVDPSDVRHQRGRFKEAFHNHEGRFADDEDKKKEMIELWKKTLKQVADLAGLDIRNQTNRHEAEFIKLIIKELAEKLNRPILNVSPYKVGIDSQVNHVNCWLQNQSADVGIAAIYGMGGIGKSNIAKIVYNQNYDSFEASSFLANIRAYCEKPSGLIGLLKQLFSDVLKGRELKTENVDVAICRIRDALGCKRLLLVLDDVDESHQLSSILGSLDWFCKGSKIIVTTRYERLLKAYGSCQMFEVSKLDDDKSLRLFSLHAFKKDYPTECYMAHTKTIVRKCDGIPLAIQAMGTSLSDQSLDYWESVIKKMVTINVLGTNIQNVLRVSYDSLRDDHDQRLFLDIACFFVGMEKIFTVQILDECGFFPVAGIQNLVDKCLITVCEDNKLMVHQLLQDMAREIVREESPDNPESRTRVWNHEDAHKILKEKSGTERITGLVLNLQLLTEEEVELKTNTFSRMCNLRILHLDYARLSGGYREISKKLRWLSWRGFHLKCIPSDFDMENLVALDLRNSYLVNVWNGDKSLQRLKILNLSHSHCLVNTPNFSRVRNLEELILKDCINLEVIHDSIEVLQKLVLLDLKGCKSLRNLPGKVGQLKSLEKLILSSCSNHEELPVELREMESFTLMSFDGTAISQLPSTSGLLRSVCNFIAKVPQSFWGQISLTMGPKPLRFSLASLPMSLRHLDLADNRLTDDVMPADISHLLSLRHLNLGGNLFSRLPESITGLTMLEELELKSCTMLESLPELPSGLKLLGAKGCVSLERINFEPKYRSRYLSLDLKGCDRLVEFQNVFTMAPLVTFDQKVLCDLGLVGFQYKEKGIQLEMINMLSGTRKKGPVQGLYEFGILSTSYPCARVPDWCSIKSSKFTIPSRLNMKVQCLSLCAPYKGSRETEDMTWNEKEGISKESISVTVRNISKGLEWHYRPTLFGTPRSNKRMIWIGQSRFENKLEAGDVVQVSFSYGIVEYGMNVDCARAHISYEKLHDKEIVKSAIHEDFEPYVDMLRAPLVTFDQKVLCNLGLVGFEYQEKDIQLEMINMLSGTREKGPIQGLYELGVLSAFRPSRFSPLSLISEKPVRFVIHSLFNMKVQCLKFCAWYDGMIWKEQGVISKASFSVTVRNISKRLEWHYSPTLIGRPRGKEYMTWEGQSRFGNKFEAGDGVEVLFSSALFNGEAEISYEKLIHGDFESYDDMFRAQSLDSNGSSMIFGFIRSIRSKTISMRQRGRA